MSMGMSLGLLEKIRNFLVLFIVTRLETERSSVLKTLSFVTKWNEEYRNWVYPERCEGTISSVAPGCAWV